MPASDLAARRFGTFGGVFTPTILTIVGVILFLRLGWVVGQAGLTGAIIIILLAHVATITTGLSLSSLSTNTRVKAGGFYAMLAHSLGLEVAGAIGIPLYLSQSLGAALYIIGFSEIWLWLFPEHDVIFIVSITLAVLLVVSYAGARFAVRTQYLIMVVLVVALGSFLAGAPLTELEAAGDSYQALKDSDFWTVFAIFFPAVTGIGAGAAMSGDLKDPGRSLPRGILLAVAVGLVLYLVAAILLGIFAGREQLVQNYYIMLDMALWREAVVAGILGATLSSALGTLVGAPRILMAMAQDRVIPAANFLGQTTKGGEPRNAILITGVLVEASLLLGSLESVATLLTMFFLITYGAINLAVFIEKGIGIPSFRPVFDIPLVVPFLGAVWCLAIMFVINPPFAGVAMLFILIFYVYLVRQGLVSPGGDIRGGLFQAISEWAAKMSARLPRSPRSWKPNLMIPLEDPVAGGSLINHLAFDLAYPSGSLRLFHVRIVPTVIRDRIKHMAGVMTRPGKKPLPPEQTNFGQTEHELPYKSDPQQAGLGRLVTSLRARGSFVAGTVVEARDFLTGLNIITQTVRGMFFPPNSILFTMSDNREKDAQLAEMMAIAERSRLGLIIATEKERWPGPGRIQLWLRVGSPNRNLPVLTALQLASNWGGSLHLYSVLRGPDNNHRAAGKMKAICERGRLPASTEVRIFNGDFLEIIARNGPGALNIFGLGSQLDIAQMHQIRETAGTPCLFVRDSGVENVLV